MSTISKLYQKYFGALKFVSLNHRNIEPFLSEMNQDSLGEDFENQYKIAIQTADDVPPVWINWHDEYRSFVVYFFTGEFVQVGLGAVEEWNPEYQFEGQKFSLDILSLAECPKVIGAQA